MKYSHEELNEAIYTIIPQFKSMTDNGVAGNQPMMLKAVAEKHFIDCAWKDRRNYDLAKSYDLCHKAMIDLSKLGYFDFRKE